MPSSKSPNYSNAFKLVVVCLFLGTVYFVFIPKYGFFLFSADYELFKTWYPNHYHAAYSFIQAFKLLLGGGILYLIWNFWHNRNEFLKLGKRIYAFVEGELSNLTLDIRDKEYECRYILYFFTGQVGLLIVALIGYYLISDLYDGTDAFQYQLLLSRVYILAALNATILFSLINRMYLLSKTLRFLFTASTPYNLAVYRIIFFLLLALNYMVYANYHIQYIESKPREALPFIGWLIDILPISKELFYATGIAGAVSCLFLVFGLFTRFFLFVNAVLVFYVLSVPNFYGKLWHSQLPIWISWFLLFAPVSDVFSLDRLLFKRKEPLVKSPDYNFPIKIIWLQMGFIYFWAGFYKLIDGGFEWCLGPSMINQVRLEWFEHFDKIPFFRVDLYPWLLNIGGMLVIFFELLFIVFLFHSRLKYISILGGLAMHNIIGVFMYIFFQPLQMQYIVFPNYEKILLWLKKIIPVIPVKEKIEQIKPVAKKSLIVFSFFVFGMNFIFGMFQISSFPFSVYPTYSEIIQGDKEFLHYSVLDSGKENTDIWELGKNSDFRWEDFTRLEYAIIRKYDEQKQVDTLAINNQWKWWSNRFAELQDIDSIDVYIYKRSLNPDSAKIILNKRYLCRIYANEDLKIEK